MKYYKEGFGLVEEISKDEIKIDISNITQIDLETGDIYSVLHDYRLTEAVIATYPRCQEGANYTYITFDEDGNFVMQDLFCIYSEDGDDEEPIIKTLGYQIKEN